MGDLGTDAGQQRQAGAVQMMRQAMMDHCQDARVAQQHFIDAARCRVAVIGRQHVGVEYAAQARQGAGKVLHQAYSVGVDLGVVGLAAASDITQFQACLSQEGI
ncbi:hypothetical protein D9M71_540560 [compost metagenome]